MKTKSEVQSIVLDELDKNIIREFHSNGKQSYRQISRKLDTTEGTIKNRTRQLLKKDVFELTANVNLSAFGFKFGCILALSINSDNLPEVTEALKTIPQMLFLSHGTGAFNLVGLALFRGMEDYDDFLSGTIGKLPGITRISTILSWGILKNSCSSDISILDSI